MARPFTKEEAKELINLHKKLLNDANFILSLNTNIRRTVETTSEKLRDIKANEFLKTVPVDEIRKVNPGARVKLLEENGYNFISDLSNTNAVKLSNINGIGQETGQEIINAAIRLSTVLRNNTKLRISADDRNPESTTMLKQVYVQFEATTPIAKTKNVYDAEAANIEPAINDLIAANDSFAWLFVPAEKKQKATEAYNYLKSLKTNGYAQIISESKAIIDNALNVSDDQVWEDYISNVIPYNNQLEKLNPKAFGSEDELQGLPESLAKEISEQSLYTDGLNCELRRYQEWGVKYALHQGKFILGDEMGLGKTIQAIATMVSLSCTGDTHFVVVCPASVIANWCREIASKSKLTPIKVHGAEKEKNLQDWIINGGVAVTTYETTDKFQLDENFMFSMIVVDEAHYIKNPGAQRSKNVRAICEHAQRIMFMTGTAIENKVDEMIELFSILDPVLAAKLKGTSFMSAAPEFRKMIAPVYYRRKREDVLTELPEKIETQEWCELNKEEEKVYEQAILEGKFNLARRVSWNAPDINESCKAKRLLEICDEAKEEGRKIIVFSFFLDTMKTVTELLGDRCVSIINGSVPPQKRQEIIDEFEKAPAGAVLPAQIQAGGTGLNIQSASVVVICEPQYKPSIENQAISRAYRMGQARNVLVYRLLCEDSIDEKITKLLEDKQEVFNAFADESEAAKENLELDEKSLGDLIQEEIDRIKEKRAQEIS